MAQKESAKEKGTNDTYYFNSVVIGKFAQLMVDELQRLNGTSQDVETGLLGISRAQFDRLTKGKMQKIPVEYIVRLCNKSGFCSDMIIHLLHEYNDQITGEKADEIRKKIAMLPKPRYYDACKEEFIHYDL